MQAADFLKNATKYSSERLFYLYGTEPYFLELSQRRLLSMLSPDNPEWNVTRFQGKAEISEIFAMCEQVPCFAEHRVVVLADLDVFAKTEEAKKLLEYLEHAPETAKILVVYSGQPDNRKVFFKGLPKLALTIEAAQLKEQELLRWVAATAKKKGFKLLRPEAEFLVEVSGSDMHTILNELGKLAMLGIAQPTCEDMRDILSKTTEFNTFHFHDYMMNGQYEQAFSILAQIQKDAKEYLKFLGLIISKFAPMVLAKSCLNAGYTDSAAALELSKRAGIKNYPAQLAVRDAKRYTLRHLKYAIRLLEEYDFVLKTGGPNEGSVPLFLKLYCE